ncbi:hemolysin family protein [Schleiferiaceae bacterium]|jgi:putative hemolysin|nr:hemolysin family protein [Schleiferiaceae bacterium]MDA9151315.1 hemolysin family protein [Schleiferiaceae bacterium]MDC3353622.1 hemolysin family protein [Schleiferiaceae bacterium]
MSEGLSLLLALVCSAFFSGMEIAYLSANRLQIEIETKRSTLMGRWLAYLIAHPGHFIGAMLMGNTLALVLVGLKTAALLDPWLLHYMDTGWAVAIETLGSTLVVLFVAEYLPKAFFRHRANDSLRWFTAPLMLIYLLLWPLVEVLTRISRMFLRRMGRDIQSAKEPVVFGRADLDHYLEEGSSAEEVEPEIELFRNALDFGDTKVRSCMVPRTEICAVPASISMEELREQFTETGFSKLVVYRETIDDAFAYVHAFGLFRRPKRLASILTPLSFVPETMSAQEVFKMLIREKRSMASVVDDLGSLTGIVTLEDVVEELFGEIDDEHDSDIRTEEVLSNGTWKLDASLEVDYLNETYGFDWPEEDAYSTLGGLIADHLGHLPVEGETLQLENWVFTIETMDAQRIACVIVSKDQD